MATRSNIRVITAQVGKQAGRLVRGRRGRREAGWRQVWLVRGRCSWYLEVYLNASHACMHGCVASAAPGSSSSSICKGHTQGSALPLEPLHTKATYH
jgi:hypothetical protein